MVSNSLLVKIPSSPFHLDTLRPDAYLAKLAGHLVEAGHQTTIWDFGTVEMMQRLYPESLRRKAVERIDQRAIEQDKSNYLTLWDQWRNRRRSNEIQRHQESVWREIAQSVIAQKMIDFVLFEVDSHSDKSICELIVPLIRYARPHLTLVGTGQLFQKDSGHLPDSLPLFDCIYWGSSGDNFMEWVDVRHDPASWSQVPFLAYSDSVRMYITKSDRGLIEFDEVHPNYSAEIYPALHEETKILYFDIEEVIDTSASDTVHIKSPARAADEIKMLSKHFNTLSFHINGSSSEYRHAEAMAHEFLKRHLNIRYTRECHIATTSAAAVSALSASGCYSIEFQIDSGSQRLLNEYYRHPFGVTQVERTIRACKFSNLVTVMNFSYPSVEDDYHTKEETIRLIRRSKPDSALISIPRQEHRKTTDLRSRFNSKPRLRSLSQILRENKDVLSEVQQRGISTQLTPPVALMAELSGYRGQEDEFLQLITYQFMTGDADGIQAATDLINRTSRKASNTISFTPFRRLQHVVGN